MSKELQNRDSTHLTKINWLERLQETPVTASMTQLEVVKMQAPAISTLNKGTGTKENGISVFEYLILDLLEFYGLEWSDTQIRSVAEILFDEYYYFSVSEIKHFMLKTKKGDFGKVYGKFSPAMLMEYAATYNGELLEARASYRPIQPEIPEKGCVPSEMVSEALNGFISQWEVELEEQERIEAEKEKEQRAKDLAAYAQLMNVNLEEVQDDILKDNQNSAA